MKNTDYLVFFGICLSILSSPGCKPRLDSSDSGERLCAVRNPKFIDQTLLTKIALEDQDPVVRLAAVEKLNDQSTLAKVAIENPDPDSRHTAVRSAAVARLTDQTLLAKVAFKGSYDIRLEAVARLTEQSALARVAVEFGDPRVRQSAAAKLAATEPTDKAKLARVASESTDFALCLTAAAKYHETDLTDQAPIAMIAARNSNASIRKTAVEKHLEHDLLVKIAIEDEDASVRYAAIEKLTDRDQPALAKIAIEDKAPHVRIAAVVKIFDPAQLAKVVIKTKGPGSRVAALALKRLSQARDHNGPGLETLASEAAEYEPASAPTIIDRPPKPQSTATVGGGSQATGTSQTTSVVIADPGTLLQLVATSSNAMERATALLGIAHNEFMLALARSEKNALVRMTAILLLDDQPALQQIAAEDAMVEARRVAVVGVNDDAFLLQRTRADSSPKVRATCLRILHRPESIYQAATKGYFKAIREAALIRLERMGDQTRAQQALDGQHEIERQAQAIMNAANGEFAQQAIHGEFDTVRLAAVHRVQDPADLKRVTLESTDLEVVKISLAKLTNKAALDEIAVKASDASVCLAASQKSGTKSWDEIFHAAAGNVKDLGEAVAAVALFSTVQTDAKLAVNKACIDLISRGDESRIPEMVDLLELYGDAQLCEDYLNCGQPELDNASRAWAAKRGFNINLGTGSHRANWGTGK